MKLLKITERRTGTHHLINPHQIVQVVPDYANDTCIIYMAGNSLANGMSFAISEAELAGILSDLAYEDSIYDFTVQARAGDAIVEFAYWFMSLDPEWGADAGELSDD